ncbi:MAG: PIG-L family deacetylase [Chloroflexota bacterium]
MTYHLFLSPHLDDVPLSCGGILAKLSDTTANISPSNIKVLTIFAGELADNTPISEFAAYQHRMWGHPNQAYQIRRAEDEQALAQFNLTPSWLNFLDCIYRGDTDQGQWYYNSDDDIFGLLHPAEFLSVDVILSQIVRHIPDHHEKSEILIYAPLTVGRHVDHQLIFLAAIFLRINGYTVLFYEEFPYTDRDPDHISVALEQTTPALLKRIPAYTSKINQTSASALWISTIQQFSVSALQRKIAAIKAYQTQLDVLFGGEAKMIERVTAYGQQIGNGNYAERFWHLNIE